MDIYAPAAHLTAGSLAGAQCKKTEALTVALIEECVTDAETFEPELSELLVCTTAARDANLQRAVRLIDKRRATAGQFRVQLVCWEDLCLELSGYPRLLAKHFPGWSKLDTQDEQPVLTVHWDYEGAAMDAFALKAVPRRLLDLRAVAVPFSDEQLTELDVTPEEIQQARLYNEALEKILSDGSSSEHWRKHTARQRHKEFGIKLGVRIGNEVASARDILGRLNFPPEFEVWANGDRPPSHDRPAVPARPKIGASARLEAKLAWMTGFPSLASIAVPVFEPTIYRVLPPRLWVEDQEATFRVASLAPRRVTTISGDDALTLVPPSEPGEYEVQWVVDAENLRAPVRGVLKVVVE